MPSNFAVNRTGVRHDLTSNYNMYILATHRLQLPISIYDRKRRDLGIFLPDDLCYVSCKNNIFVPLQFTFTSILSEQLLDKACLASRFYKQF